MADGTLSVRRRLQKGKEATISKLDSLDFLNLGESTAPAKQATKALQDADELRVNESRRQKRLKNYDKYLKTFKYSAALDSVLRKVRLPALVTLSLTLMSFEECPASDNLFSDPRTYSPRWPQNCPGWTRRRPFGTRVTALDQACIRSTVRDHSMFRCGNCDR